MGDQAREKWMASHSSTIPSAPPLSMIDVDLSENFTYPYYDSHIAQAGCSSAGIIKGPPLKARNVNGVKKNECGMNLECRRTLTSNVPLKSFPRHQVVSFTPPPDAVDDEPDPSAPPLELMDKVHGYETASFDNVAVPPPLMPAVLKTGEQPIRSPLPALPQLTEKEVRQALQKEVAAHCCYGSGAARDMAVVDIKHSIAFHYTLETFTEKRMTCWAFVPYTGGIVDGPSDEPVPFPWDIPVVPPQNFKTSVSRTEVPHTASVKTCHMCGGVGRKRCTTCSGQGWEYCFACHGDGHKAATFQGDHERCYQCHGTGRRKCWKCSGDGMAFCKVCSGTGQIKCFICLTVEWTNHMDDYVVDKAAAIQGDRLKTVTGDLVFEEEQPILWPLNHFPDNTVNMASTQLIQQHAASFDGEKVLLQRHRVRVIPIAAVQYMWKSNEGQFYVYGYEQKVFAPDYPQTCCCCSIL